MRQRLISDLKRALVIITVGVLYYLLNIFTGFGIPCIFRRITGYLCPACGVTRMIKAMISLDFGAAFAHNQLLFVTWPLLAVVFVCSEINYIKFGTRAVGRLNYVLWAEIALLLMFGIIRNL